MCLLSVYQEEKHQALVKKRDILDKKLVQSEKTGAKIVRHASVVGDTRSGRMFLFSVVIVFRFFFSLCSRSLAGGAKIVRHISILRDRRSGFWGIFSTLLLLFVLVFTFFLSVREVV